MKPVVAAVLSLLISSPVFADDKPATEFNSVPQPPTIPSAVKDGEVLEPDVRIIESDEQRVEEYSSNGKVYMVKITPTNGFPPYYLVDTDGDGSLDLKSKYYNAFQVPQWVLFSW
ncbi:MAG: DUF2782 domain-containing protein [Methylococcales bacterium]|jgi:hypothetical protein|nr:DUF2782 domain-containing protein [Methylococcales bacterium]MBT7445733.1 DUF2782 domain-containing protein [Methylococcales bacterium]